MKEQGIMAISASRNRCPRPFGVEPLRVSSRAAGHAIAPSQVFVREVRAFPGGEPDCGDHAFALSEGQAVALVDAREEAAREEEREAIVAWLRAKAGQTLVFGSHGSSAREAATMLTMIADALARGDHQ